MLTDKIKILIQAGNGGHGIISFRRERFLPRGGPDGGNGGHGADVIIKTNSSKYDLNHLKFQQHQKGENGNCGEGKNKTGANGKNHIILVPIGTIIKDLNENIIADLTENEQEFIICKGGKGGKGNKHFATSVNKSPRVFERGQDGESKEVILELKMIADVALVGLPNAGKTSLFNAISQQNRKTAPYPFTTLNPAISKISFQDYSSFTLIDVPGLIEKAHQNVGLGHEFLKHIERVKMIVLVSDISQQDCLENLDILVNEMKLYKKELIDKIKLIIANKIDISTKYITSLKKYNYPIIEISAIENTNIEQVIEFIKEKVSLIQQKKDITNNDKLIISLENDDFI